MAFHHQLCMPDSDPGLGSAAFSQLPLRYYGGQERYWGLDTARSLWAEGVEVLFSLQPYGLPAVRLSRELVCGGLTGPISWLLVLAKKEC